MDNKDDIKNRFAHKYYTKGIDGNRLESDRSKSEKKAKKHAVEIKIKYYEILYERDIETVELVLNEIRELLDKIIKYAEDSKSEATIDSLTKSKNVFKDISDKLTNAHLYQIYVLCKSILKEKISKEDIDRLKEKLQELMEKVDKLNKDAISVGTTLPEKTSQNVSKMSNAYQKIIELVDERETDRELERWLDGTPMEERERRAYMVAKMYEDGQRSSMTEKDIDVPIYKNAVDVVDPEV